MPHTLTKKQPTSSLAKLSRLISTLDCIGILLHTSYAMSMDDLTLDYSNKRCALQVMPVVDAIRHGYVAITQSLYSVMLSE
ncbi:hypothetical protein BDV3_006438 [Batrachochytrium dendrobatidis]